MAPFNSTNHTFPELDNVHLRDPHCTDTKYICACDHCTYFKGIVYHSAIRKQLTGDDLLNTHKKSMAAGPRSLESVALREEVIERRNHANYMAWCQVRATRADSTELLAREHGLVASRADLYNEKSDTLTKWLEGSTKEDLLAWLQNRSNERDDMDELRQMGIFDLREYIQHHRHTQKAPVRPTAASRTNVKSSHPVSSVTKKWKPLPAATTLRVQAHKSLKPPQAARRQREELHRWYDSKKATELKDECRQRCIRPVPDRKADMISRLVEDDKKGT